MEIKKFLSQFKWVLAILEVLLIIPCFVISYLSRYSNRKIDVGLGPEPLISNVYHKKALIQNGYSAETFVSGVYFTPEGIDGQRLARSKNFYFKHTVSKDYPNFRKHRRRVSNGVDRWTRHADWVIS